MANKDGFGFEVPGQVINSYKDLKNAIKAAKDEQVSVSEKFGASSAEYKKASKSVADLNDKMEDLNDSSRSLKGSGIERSAQGFSQLGEGLRNLDFDKVKIGLGAIKSALAATGIMLIVQGVMYLIQNFEELSKGSGLLAKALRVVGDVIQGAVDLLYEFTDLIGITNSELDKQGEAIADYATKTTEALQAQNKEFDNQMKVAKAAGKSTVELEKAKQQAIIDTNKLILEQIIAFVRAGGELDEEKKKLFNASIQFVKDARVEQKVIEINHNKEVNAEYKKHIKDKQDTDAAYNAAYEKSLTAQRDAQSKAWETERQEKEKNAKLYGDFQNNWLKEQGDTEWANSMDNPDNPKSPLNETNIANQKKRKADEKAAINETLAVAQLASENQAQMVNFLFDLKRSRLQKGSAEELKAAKRQFQINKAIAIQSSIISGIQGVINALSAQSVIPEPFGTILKVATAVGVGIAATVNTAKIASQQFNEGGGSSGGEASASVGGGATATAAPPSINNVANTPPSTTQFDSTGKNLSTPVKAQVVETELTATQRGVERFQEQATF